MATHGPQFINCCIMDHLQAIVCESPWSDCGFWNWMRTEAGYRHDWCIDIPPPKKKKKVVCLQFYNTLSSNFKNKKDRLIVLFCVLSTKTLYKTCTRICLSPMLWVGFFFFFPLGGVLFLFPVPLHLTFKNRTLSSKHYCFCFRRKKKITT